MGYIYKRGLTYWIQYVRNKKRYRESTGSTKYSDAKNLLQLREGDIANGKPVRVNFEKVTFDELATDLLTEYKVNKRKRINRLELSISHLKGFFEGYAAPAITSTKITDYVKARQDKKAANATINRELSALKRMFNYGAEQTPPKVLTVPYIAMLNENNARQGFFEYEDFVKLRANMPASFFGFLTFAYKLGWRKGEIQNLTWDRVNLDTGELRLEAGESKNDAPRTVVLDDELLELIKAQRSAMEKRAVILPYIFTNMKGDNMLKQFRKTWASACTKAKIGPRMFHDFRRTAIRNMVRAGIPEKVAMAISGHKTRSVFERYNIVDKKDLELAAQKISAYIETQAGKASPEVVEFPGKDGKQNVM